MHQHISIEINKKRENTRTNKARKRINNDYGEGVQ